MKKSFSHHLGAIKLCSIVLVFLSVNIDATAQLWNKMYTDQIPENAKGAYSQHANGFISTGHISQPANDLAYLMETNLNGNITWQVYLGDTTHNFYALSVKETTNGSYVVVGKTDKHQTYLGAWDDTCTLKKYYNAFIAYVDPDSSAADWYLVFGDSLLHDEAVEVIEDPYGDFVVVGQATGKFSADTCSFNDSNYVMPTGQDRASILFSKFSSNGTVIFNTTLDYQKYDSGVSLIHDLTIDQYVILANRRNYSQVTTYRPLLIQTNLAGNPLNAMEYDPSTVIDKKGFELVKYNNDYFVVGQESNLLRQPVTSFFLLTDPLLMNPAYTNLVHSYVDLLFRDVLVDNDTLVISGDSHLFPKGIQWKEQSMSKVVVNLNRQPVLVPLIGANNISHYRAYAIDRNKNFCIYPYVDSTQGTLTNYHLFGNSNQLINNVTVDHFTRSMCWQMDTIQDDSVLIPIVPWLPLVDTIDELDTFICLPPNLVEYAQCDTIIIPLAPYQDETLNAEVSAYEKVTVYPNPTREIIKVQLSGIVTAPVQVRIFDLAGHIIFQDLNYSFPSEISLVDLKNGYYIVDIMDGSKRYKLPLIKH